MTTASTFGVPMLDSLAITILQRQMSGELLQLGDTGYDTARRLVNSLYDRRPALIARCRSTEDVAHAVTFAREHDLEIAVRSGGHSVPGHSANNGGMMIDLSQMRRIDIDPLQLVAHAQPGATNGDVVLATQAHGLATTTGTCATVGMGGSTLGGGIGWLMGRFGATIDNVLAFELVTADGRIRTASADEHADLFWALRGGGGNFGVVTRISYRLHRLGPVLGGPLIFPIAAAPQALRVYRDVSGAAPDELLTHAVLATVPDFGPALIVQPVYSGEDLSEGERVLAPLRRSVQPAIDLVAPRSYAELYMMYSPPIRPGASWHDAAYTMQQPSDDALDTLIACAAERPTPTTLINIHQVHGAATRVAPDATAFALRTPHYAVVNIGMWMAGAGAAETDWTLSARDRMAPYAQRGLYVNFLGDDGESAIRDSYQANFERLTAIKGRYDAGNVFHGNQNIRPA